MSVVLQISDLHFGTERPPVLRALQTLARDLKPDLLIVSGDITQRARHSQFSDAVKYIDALGIAARVIVPGNHDVPLFNVFARMLHPFRNYRRAFGRELEPEFASHDLLVLGVNSTRPRRHTQGAVSGTQIARVGTRLRMATVRQLRLVVMHHPIYSITASDQDNLVLNHAIATQAWADAGADLILGGHIHLPYVRPLNNDERQLSRDVWSVQAGTTTSWRVRGDAPNSLNIIRTPKNDDVDAIVERWDFNSDRLVFELAGSTLIPLDRDLAR
jgi:3',5'-cyclic AMP phosphodiesterase CpdA